MPRRPRPVPDDIIPPSTVSRSSDEWFYLAGQSFIWAGLLLAIPREVKSYAQRPELAQVKARIAELEQYFPNDPDLEPLRAKVESARLVQCEIYKLDASNRWACSVARIFKKLSTWPEEREVAVEFATCRDGDLKIRCVNIDRKRELPLFVQSPSDLGDCRGTAVALVLKAIAAIDAEQ